MKHVFMRNVWCGLAILLLLTTSCNNDENTDPYSIDKHNIGLLTDSTKVSELMEIYIGDSISEITTDQFRSNIDEIDIYTKDGSKLLTLTPSKSEDSVAVIKSVQIFSNKYKTAKNISLLSTFKDINENYQISKIDNLINNVVVSVNEINASFTIDKKELPSNLRYDVNMKIEKSQIPDGAKIKYFMIHW